MSRIFKTKEILIGTAVCIALIVISAAIPLLAMLSMLFFCVPIFIVALRCGIGAGISSAVLSAVPIAVSSGGEVAAAYALGFGALGVASAAAYDRTKSVGDLVAVFVAMSVALKVCAVILLSAVTGVNVLSPDLSQVEQVLTELAGSGLISPDAQDLDAIKESISLSLRYASTIIPSTLMLFAAAEALCALKLSPRFLSSLPAERRKLLPPLREWGFPKNIYLVFAAGLILELFGGGSSIRAIPMIAANLMMISRAIFIIQGLAAVAYFVDTKHAPQVLKYVIVIASPFVSILGDMISMLGICDIGFDLRKRRS